MASGPITSWQIHGETVEAMSDFILGGSKITADGDCSHEIKRCLLVVDQFSQHHLLKRLSFLHCIFLPPLSKIRCPQVRGCICGLSVFLFPLIYISVLVPVPYCLDDCGFVVEPEVRQVDSSSSILLSQDCFGCYC